MEQIRQIYETYLVQAREARRRLKPTDGLFGIGERLENAPCHDAFYQAVEEQVARLAAGAESREAYEALAYIYQGPQTFTNVDRVVYWMLIAVQGRTLPLIPRLNPDQARQLRDWYQEVYPRWKRLPVQDQVLAELNKRGKE